MPTSGVFNRDCSARYFVNIPEHGVCSLRGLLLSLRCYRQGMFLALKQGCTLTTVRVWIIYFFFRYGKRKSLYQTTKRWARGFIYNLLSIIWMINSRRTRCVGGVTSVTSKDKFLGRGERLVGKHEGKRIWIETRCWWEDNIEVDLT
jgi:hypothetical protein